MKNLLLALACLCLTSCATVEVGGVTRTEVVNLQAAGGFYVAAGVTGNTAAALNWLSAGLSGVLRGALSKIGLVKATTPTCAIGPSVSSVPPGPFSPEAK